MTQKIRFYKYADQSDIILNLDINNNESLPDINLTSNGFSFEEKPPAPFNIDFKLAVNSDIFKLVVPENAIEDEDDFQYFVSCISPLSRKRQTIELSKSKDISLTEFKNFEGNILIDPEEWFGSVSFHANVVRKKTRKNEVSGFLTDKYSIIGNSHEHVVYIEPLEKFDGSEIEMDDGPIPQADALYQLIQSNPPKIMINEDAPEFTLKMLRYKGTKNDRRVLIRDTLFAPILVDVWEQLARAGIYKMLPEADNGNYIADTSELPHPYRTIVEHVAKKIYSDSDDPSKALVEELEEDPKTVINEKLHQAVQAIGDLSKYYEKCAKPYWRD